MVKIVEKTGSYHSAIWFNNEDRKIAVKILESAKGKIESGSCIIICFAIGSIASNNKSRHRFVKIKLTDLIRKRLSGSPIYESWLRINHQEIWEKSVRSKKHVRNMQQARIQWLDSLIKEFKE